MSIPAYSANAPSLARAEAASATLLDSRVEAKVAIVFDWENRWAIEFSSGPSVALKYVDEVHKYYDALSK